MKQTIALALMISSSICYADFTILKPKSDSGEVLIKVSKDDATDANITLNIQISGSNDRDIADLTNILSNWFSTNPNQSSFLKQQIVTALLTGTVTAAAVVAAQMFLNGR